MLTFGAEPPKTPCKTTLAHDSRPDSISPDEVATNTRATGSPCPAGRDRSASGLPIDNGPVEGVVRFRVPPVVIDLVGNCLVVDLDAEAGPGRQLHVAVRKPQRFL